MQASREILTRAVQRHQAGRLEEAAGLYEQVLQAEPNQVDALHLLGVVRCQRGDAASAVELIQRAAAIHPRDPAILSNLGIALRNLGRLEEAADAYGRALALKPDFPDAWYNLGITRKSQGRLEEAVEAYRRAVAVQPRYASAWNNLGSALADLGRTDEAIAAYQQALAARPNLADAHNNLGVALKANNAFAEAEASYRRALECQPNSASANHNLGNLLVDQGRIEEAVAVYREAVRLAPDRPLWELRLSTLSPTVFPSMEAIDAYRHALAEAIARFAQRDFAVDLAELGQCGAEPPFDLQFDHANIRPVKEAYAGIFESRWPEQPPVVPDGKPRVGIIVTRGHEYGFVKSLGGVLGGIDTREFDIVVLTHHAGEAKLREGIRRDDIPIHAFPQRFDHAARAVREARCDVLYYWEVGTDGTNYFLPFCRLAPVQCTSWGIQVTSGIGAMDYYLSSRLVEPDDAADHYREELLLADTLLTCQERGPAPPAGKGRDAFGLAAADHVYLCAQHLGKFHPAFDAVLAEILRADGRGKLVITEDRFGRAAARLRERFARTLPDVAQRIVFLPQLVQADYLALMAAADVLLDPPHFGGVNTTYDGFSLGKPIVTQPSAYHRGRYTAGCYRKMGITDCLAASPEEYAALAVALGADADRRAEVGRRIAAAAEVLFGDRQAVAEHERLFRMLAERARGGG